MTQHPCEKLDMIRALVDELFGPGTPLEIDLPPLDYHEAVRYAQPDPDGPRRNSRPIFKGIRINEQRVMPRLRYDPS